MIVVKHKKHIGVTLLFFQSKKSSYTAFLKSYILKYDNWKDLQIKIKQTTDANKELTYLGLEDVFYVSGPFKEREVLGKSYIDEIVKVKDVKRKLLKNNEYTFKFQVNNKKEKWFLFSLMYFYHDKNIDDKLAISCFTPVLANNVKAAKTKIKAISETKVFLKKILPFKLDRMFYTNLKYIGIEDISYIEEDMKNGGAFEYSFKMYRKIEKIKELLPSNEKILKSFKQISNIN